MITRNENIQKAIEKFAESIYKEGYFIKSIQVRKVIIKKKNETAVLLVTPFCQIKIFEEYE